MSSREEDLRRLQQRAVKLAEDWEKFYLRWRERGEHVFLRGSHHCAVCGEYEEPGDSPAAYRPPPCLP